MPPSQEQPNPVPISPAPASVPAAPVSKHSAWFYIVWIAVVIIFVPIVLILARFAYIEFQLTQARQAGREAQHQAQIKFQEVQDAINASEATSADTSTQ